MMGIRIGWSLLILLVMFMPLPGDSAHWFKGLVLIIHFSLFSILGGLNRDLVLRPELRKSPFIRVLAILAMVCVPEIVQSFIPTRSFQWLDLVMNGLGTGWGLTMGVYAPWLTYLFLSSALLGFSFGMNVLKDSVRPILFGESSPLLTVIGLLVPILFGLGFYKQWDRTTILSLVLFVGSVTMLDPGRGVLIGGLSLVGFFMGRFRRDLPATTSLEILGLSGFVLFLGGTEIGPRILLEHGGLIVVGGILLVSSSLVWIQNQN